MLNLCFVLIWLISFHFIFVLYWQTEWINVFTECHLQLGTVLILWSIKLGDYEKQHFNFVTCMSSTSLYLKWKTLIFCVFFLLGNMVVWWLPPLCHSKKVLVEIRWPPGTSQCGTCMSSLCLDRLFLDTRASSNSPKMCMLNSDLSVSLCYPLWQISNLFMVSSNSCPMTSWIGSTSARNSLEWKFPTWRQCIGLEW